MRSRLLLSFACAGLLSAQQAPVDRAWDLLAKGDRQQATVVLLEILKKNARDGEARLLLGSILTEDGKLAEATAELEAAVRLMPRNAMAHNALGEARSATGDLKGARAAFENAVLLDAKFSQARVNLGLALLQAGEPEPAAKHLDAAITAFGRTEDAAYPLYLRAKIYAEADHHEQASAALRQAVGLRPDFAEAWSDLGQSRKALLDDAGALAAFKRSVGISPENAVSQYRLGAEYLNQDKPSLAVTHLRKSLRVNPRDQSTLYSLQLALRQNGELEEAKRVKQRLSEVLREIDRESQRAFAALALNNDGAALEKTGSLSGAVEKYRAASVLDPEHIGIRVNLGVVLLRLGQWEEGLSCLREALRKDPANLQIKAALEDALEQAPVEFGGKGKKVAK